MMRLEIVAHDTGAPADLRDEEVLAMALDDFDQREVGIDVHAVSRRERSVAGVTGVQIINRLTTAEGILYDVSWIGSRAGVVYWLSLIAPSRTVQGLVLESEKLFARFSLLDPQRTVSPQAAVTRFRSDRFGYSLELAGTGLVESDPASWPKRVEFAAMLPQPMLTSASLIVIPVFVSDLSVDPDLADVALCSMIDPNVMDWKLVLEQDDGGVRIREYEGTSVESGRAVVQRARILQRDRYFIAVSVNVMGSQGRKKLLDTAGRLELDPKPPGGFPSPLTPAEQLRQQLFFNEMGIVYVHAGRAAEAVDFFERAEAFGSDDPIYARNLAESRLRAGRPREATVGCDAALVSFPDDAFLIGFRGIARAALGERTAAGADFRRAYELGNRSDDVIVGHALSLTEQGQLDAALEVVDARIAEASDPGARVLRAIVLRRAGRRDESVAELRQLLHDHPRNEAIRGAMVDAAIEDGDPEMLLEATDELVAQDQTGLVHYLRALALHALGRTDAAIAALDEAAQRTTDSAWILELRERIRVEQGSTQRDT